MKLKLQSMRHFLSKYGWPSLIVMVGLLKNSPLNHMIFIGALVCIGFIAYHEYVAALRDHYEKRLKMYQEKLDTINIDAKITMNKFLNLGDIKDPIK